MKIAVLGTGMVGRALAGKLAELGHQVAVGTRDVAELMARDQPTMGGRVPPFRVWREEHPEVEVRSFADAAAGAELVVNATSGAASLEALGLAGEGNLDGKVLLDVANPLDFSRGMPPTLFVCNDDSLAERIQREFLQARVVKSLNTVNALVMVDPGSVAGGDHHLFVCGNDAGAKATVKGLLEEIGWSTFSTWATSPPPAAPRWSCRSGSASWASSERRSSTSGSCGDGSGRSALDGSISSCRRRRPAPLRRPAGSARRRRAGR